jgi:hypothetical protein
MIHLPPAGHYVQFSLVSKEETIVTDLFLGLHLSLQRLTVQPSLSAPEGRTIAEVQRYCRAAGGGRVMFSHLPEDILRLVLV